MADFDGHITGGIVTSIISTGGMFYYTHDLLTSIYAGLITLVFSLYPDMDIHSKSNRYLSLISLIAVVILHYYFKLDSVAWIVAILTIIPSIFKHRGFAHSLIFMGILTSLGIYYVGNLGYFVTAGFLTHLTLDKHFSLI